MNMADPQTFNRYAYVENNPLNRIDPTGTSDDRVGPWEGVDWHWGLDTGGPNLRDKVGGCMLDGVSTLCEFVYRNSLATANCSQCGPGRTVGLDNKIYERQWIPPYFLHFGSVTDTSCTSDQGVCSGDVYIQHHRGHFSLVSVGSLTEGIQDVYPPMAQQLFQGNHRVFQNANQITDPRTIALWYAASAAVALVPYVPEVEIYGCAALECGGIPVTAASSWVISNWRTLDNLRKIGNWMWNN